MINTGNIQAKTDRDETVFIILEHWDFMDMGQGHIILQNNCKTDPLFWNVISICIHKFTIVPPQLIEIYEQTLNSIENIKLHLLERRRIIISREDSPRFIHLLERITPKKIIFQQDLVINISQNLKKSKSDWNYFIEFKPKTPLPDIYSNQFISNFCKQNQLVEDDLKKIMNQRPIIERTRWFKKKLIKKQKTNLNPLGIFQILQTEKTILVSKLTNIDECTCKTDITANQDSLNSQILKLLKQSKIIYDILRIQCLFKLPNDFVADQMQTQISSHSVNFIKSNIINGLKYQGKIQQQVIQLLQNESAYFKEQIQTPIELTINQLKFLISYTWRDISIIIRLKIDNISKQVIDSQIKIIDYELKQGDKLKSAIQKDALYLTNYCRYLKSI